MNNSIKSALGNLIDSLEKRIYNQGLTVLQGLPTGFLSIDKLLNGLKPERLILIGGRPASCKTLLLINFAANVSEQAFGNVIFCSNRHRKEELTSKLLTGRANIKSIDFERAELCDSQWAKITRALQSLVSLNNLYFLEDFEPAASFQTLKTLITDMQKRNEKVSAIIIDGATTHTMIENKQIATTLSELRKLAKEHSCAVVASCTLKIDADKRAGKRPILSDLSNAEAIEEHADVIALLTRNYELSRGNIEINVLRNNCGRLGSAYLSFSEQSLKVFG